MERTHEFTINLDDERIYAITLLDGVEIEHRDGTTVGHWPAFDLDATGENEADVYQKLVRSLQEQTVGAGSP